MSAYRAVFAAQFPSPFVVPFFPQQKGKAWLLTKQRCPSLGTHEGRLCAFSPFHDVLFAERSPHMG